jgi:hypothetical protein
MIQPRSGSHATSNSASKKRNGAAADAPKPDDVRLPDRWVVNLHFWSSNRNGYTSAYKGICEFGSGYEFGYLVNALPTPHALARGCTCHNRRILGVSVFLSGVLPLWECAPNDSGFSMCLRDCSDANTTRVWHNMFAAACGGTLGCVGIRVVTRPNSHSGTKVHTKFEVWYAQDVSVATASQAVTAGVCNGPWKVVHHCASGEGIV